jgi:preprotein translocase subunit SecG
VLTKATTGLAAAFIVLALVLAAWGQRGPGSVVGGTLAPAAPPAAAVTPPSNTSPK